LERFFLEMDKNLTDAGSVVVIGGAAAILQYGSTQSTVDIDTYSAAPPGLEGAIRSAWASTGLEISVQYAAVADAPYGYEDRLERLTSPRLQRLEVLVPERHDLALMKLSRGEERDLAVLEELHARRPFDLDTLVTRYLDEMGHAMQDARILQQKFLLFVQRLFDKESVEQTRERLERIPLERQLAATSVVVTSEWLHSLGLRPETLASARFEGAIRQDLNKRIVFPIRDDAGVVALSLWGPQGEEVKGRRDRGVWTSQAVKGDRAIVLVADPLDALAAHQATPGLEARYVAIDSPMSPAQSQLLRRMLHHVPQERDLLLAFPRGRDGQRLTAAVNALVPERTTVRHLPRRGSSWSAFVKSTERAWIARAAGRQLLGPDR
jgi:hypothetical protein